MSSYRRNGGRHVVAAGEVVLSGGAINTPQLLQLSGVGRRRSPASLGHPPVVDLPGVGANLQDHLEVYVQHACTPAGSCSRAAQWRHPWVGLQWLAAPQGPAATNHFEGGGFVRSNDDVAYPNLMFHFLPIAVRYDGYAPMRQARLPGAHRADVLRRPGLGEDHVPDPG